MLHGRMVHPKTLGSTLVSAGEVDKTKYPHAQVIVKGNLVGVVAPTEWEAIQAAQQVADATKWTDWKGLPGNANLYDYLRNEADWKSTPVMKSRATRGDAGAALAAAKKKLSATYQLSYMKHAPIGPTMAVGDVQAGRHGAHPHAQSESAGAARRDCEDARHHDRQVIVHIYPGPGHYGRSNGGNAGAEDEAVILSQAVGKPVRVQWMRADDMQWSTQSPVAFSDVELAVDERGQACRLPDRPLYAGDAGRQAGGRGASGAADDGCAGRSRRLHHLHDEQHCGRLDLWRGCERDRARAWHVPGGPEGVAHCRGPARPQHAHADAVPAELSPRAGDQRSGGAGGSGCDSIPHRQSEGRARHRRAESGTRCVGLGYAAIATCRTPRPPGLRPCAGAEFR